MNDAWYYLQEGAARGPVSYFQLGELAQAGAIGPGDFVWQEGQPEWISATAAGLFEPVVTPPPLPTRPPAAPPRVVAASGSQVGASHGQPSGGSHPLKWPLIVAGGGMSLLALAIFGWIASSLLHRAVPDRSVAAAPAVAEGADAEEPQPLPRIEYPSLPPTSAAPPVPPTSAPDSPPPWADPNVSSPAEVPAEEAAPKVEVASPPPSSPTEAPAAAPMPTPPPSAATPSGSQTFFQELDIRRAPKFSILGNVTIQDLHYQMLSELKASAPDDAGSRSVEQYVLETKLLKADELSRPMFEQSLAALRGWWFRYKLNKGGEIVEWKAGPPDGRRAARIEPPGGAGFLMTSVMDEDGWKEMARLSFLVPDDATSGSQPWVRQMSHDFGPLGSWYGETRFQRQGTTDNLLRVDYTHAMTYTPPDKDRPVGGGLPLVITAADFKPEVAGGSFYFDTVAGRVQRVQERFLVRGAVQTELVGQAVTVEVEEDQSIGVRILTENPWEK